MMKNQSRAVVRYSCILRITGVPAATFERRNLRTSSKFSTLAAFVLDGELARRAAAVSFLRCEAASADSNRDGESDPLRFAEEAIALKYTCDAVRKSHRRQVRAKTIAEKSNASTRRAAQKKKIAAAGLGWVSGTVCFTPRFLRSKRLGESGGSLGLFWHLNVFAVLY